MRVNKAANSTQKKTLRRGLCRGCGFSTGVPRPHRARRTWSKPGCCQSGCLTISHNCGLRCLDSNQAQHPALRLVSYSRRAHYFAEQPAISCARRTIAIPASAIPVVCSFYRQKPRRQHLCIVERLLGYRYQPRFPALPITGRLFRLPRLDHLLSALVGGNGCGRSVATFQDLHILPAQSERQYCRVAITNALAVVVVPGAPIPESRRDYAFTTTRTLYYHSLHCKPMRKNYSFAAEVVYSGH